jgi:hypothetical protein
VVNGPWIWIGAAIMIISEAATIAKIEPFWSWNTPIAWTGFILPTRSWQVRRDSWIRSAPAEFVLLALVSTLCGSCSRATTWSSELALRGAAREPARYFGYAWSFATIWPALFWEQVDHAAIIPRSRCARPWPTSYARPSQAKREGWQA